MLPYNKKLKRRARELRSRMTDAEVFLWSKLRRKQLYGLTFCRQKTIGNYIVDFYCLGVELVIEVDGGQHYLEEGALRDAQRDRYLRGLGLMVLRFSNTDVLKNIDGVIGAIVQAIEKSSDGTDRNKSKTPWPPF
jgi:very-short-patch-repair endonuclease